MELAKIIEKTNKKTGRNILEEIFTTDAELYRYDFIGERTFTISDVGIYEIMYEIMKGWWLKNMKKLRDVVPNFGDFGVIVEEGLSSLDENITYNIEEIMKAYDPNPPLVISIIAKHLLGNSGVVREFCESVFTHWKCYNYKVFEEELKKNTKEAIERYISALNILTCNLPVFILICAKEQKKTK